LKEHIETAERDILRLNQQLRSQKAEKEIKISEMAGTIRLLSGRSDLHSLLASVRQDLEAEELTSNHLKGEIESYK